MPNRKHQYYVDDIITFRGTFKQNGVAQTPDADTGLATIKQYGVTAAIVDAATAIISGTQIQYKYTADTVGQFAIFLSAQFESGADKRTGVIEFIVRAKESH